MGFHKKKLWFQRLDEVDWLPPLLKILVNVPWLSPRPLWPLAELCDFWSPLDLGVEGEAMFLKKCTTAFSSARRRGDELDLWGEEDKAPRKDPFPFFFLSPPKNFPIWSMTVGFFLLRPNLNVDCEELADAILSVHSDIFGDVCFQEKE